MLLYQKSPIQEILVEIYHFKGGGAMPAKLDLTDMQFGLLIARKREGDKWLCECDCGNWCLVSVSHLRSGHTRSCGCFHKQNEYIMSGRYGKMIFDDGRVCVFDKEDFELLSKHYWSPRPDGHIRTSIKGKTVEIARYILESHGENIDGLYVDHRDRDPLNNRKKNYRVCSFRENRMNHSLFKNNTSGYSGVTYKKSSGKWVARITVNYNRIFLGLYDTKEEAIQARKRAEQKYYGQFASGV